MTPLIALCLRHIEQLENHNFCPICGLLCATRPYVRCRLKHRSHDHCLEGLKTEKCPHCGEALAESLVPRPISTYPEISGMITFPDQHLAAKEVKVKPENVIKYSKTISLGDLDLPLIELAGKDSHWHHLQVEAESLITDNLSESFNILKSMNMENWSQKINVIKSDDDIGKLLLVLSGRIENFISVL